MSLRSRLVLSFALVMLAPLVTTGALLSRAVPAASDAKLQARLFADRDAVVGALVQDCLKTTAAAADLARAPGLLSAPSAVAQSAVAADRIALVFDPAGHLLGSVHADTRTAALLVGTEDCRNRLGLLMVSKVALQDSRGRNRGSVIVGWRLTKASLIAVQPRASVGVTLSEGSTQLTTEADPSRAAAIVAVAGNPEQGRTGRIGHLVVAGAELAPIGKGHPYPLVLALGSVRQGVGGLIRLVVLALLATGLLAAVIGVQVARMTTRPLVALGEAARRVAAGDLTTRLPVEGRDELARLATAFNTMTDELSTTIGALQASRDELRGNLSRLGDTLSSTHDLGRILAVILETALGSVRAEAGALMLATAGRGDLFLRAGRGLEGRLPVTGVDSPTGRGSLRVRLGEGVSGKVALTGQAVRGEVGNPELGGLVLAPEEPRARSLIAVPLRSGGRVTGVLNLYDRVDGQPFTAADLETISSFAVQATVAIDNVLLHQEAERLSITDGLTGLWNYRYLMVALAREVERAVRFQRPLGVLMLDLDLFKVVNDEYGHQRGDAVLVEVARRVKSVIREVDVLARYGGEELVLLLPETDTEGAIQLAERVRTIVRELPFGEAGERLIPVTLSIGVSIYPQQGSTGPELLRQADEALYSAKAAGRDCWRLAPASATAP